MPYQNTPKQSPKSHFRPNWEFWAVFLIPWLLDLGGGRTVLASVFGASLWGMAVVVALAHTQTRDPRFKAKLGFVLSLLSACWLTYWVMCFSGPRPTFFGPTSLRWLTLFHAALLASGAGMIIILFVTSLMWILQDTLLRKSSWERRTIRGKLPSIESLSRVCTGTIGLAKNSWGLGLVLAFLTALMRWKRANLDSNTASMDWLLDIRILGTAILWVMLGVGDRLGKILSPANPWLYRWYFILSILFLLSFASFVSGDHPILHEPINWFVR